MPDFLLRDAPVSLWRAVKAKAALQGKPIRTVIIELLTRWAKSTG